MWTLLPLAQIEQALSWFGPLMNAGAASVMAGAFVWMIAREPQNEKDRHAREMERDQQQDVREEKRWRWHEKEITSITGSVDTLRASVEKLAERVADLPCRNHAGLVNLSLPGGSSRQPAASQPASPSSVPA